MTKSELILKIKEGLHEDYHKYLSELIDKIYNKKKDSIHYDDVDVYI